MARRRPASSAASLRQAFDELAYGPDRILNLRAHLPTRGEAVARAESWLRERQVAGAEEVLIVTGRGLGSVDGVSVVRQGVLELLGSLRRRNVVAGYREHTAGAFVVELAPAHALYQPPRRRPPAMPPEPDARSLAGLDADTRARLRTLATVHLQHLGVHSPTRAIVEDEMVRQFATLAALVPPGPDRERQLRRAVERALDEQDL